uniref:3'-5' exonuclease domain-containing protein n=1 Tax=Heterorhabditis bacteriophora TaxID=37862 RepID=A0A1I7XBF5_HETBA
MTEEEDPVVILDNICDLYKIDSTHFYTSTTHKGRCMKDITRFDFGALARKVFDQVPREKLPYLYFSLFTHIKFYCDMRRSDLVGNKSILSSLISLRELVLNLVVSYQLPWYQKITSDGIQDNPKRKARCIPIAPRAQLDVENSQKLIREFLSVPVSNESKIWKQIRYIFVPDNSDIKLRQLSSIIVEAINDGYAREHYPTNLRSNNSEKCCYDTFLHNTDVLMRDLRGESRSDSLIAHGWAYAAVNKYAKKTYIEKTWKEENLYDLIWTVIVQRPYMKRYICELLEKNFHDYGAAKFWRRMQPAQMNRVYIKNGNITQIDPLAPSDKSLNFLSDVKEIVFVHRNSELKHVFEILDTVIGSNGTVEVGMDSEWSAYVGSSKATILQLALNDRIFILDLESNSIPAETFKTFFDKLFLDSKIFKLGFRFSEDLIQLRAAFNQCSALYRPENIICIGRLVSDLRYAAMDAYCLLLLYSVCKQWAHRLGISINDVVSRQDPIRVSPPLLSEEF